jgi:hypothetical protein
MEHIDKAHGALVTVDDSLQTLYVDDLKGERVFITSI